MMAALARQVEHIALLAHVGIHGLDRGGFVVIAADVQALDTQALVDHEVFGRRAVDLLFLCCLADRPVEVLARDEVGQADDGHPLEGLLVGIHALPFSRSTAHCLA